MEPEDYYRSAPTPEDGDDRANYPVLDRSRNSFDAPIPNPTTRRRSAADTAAQPRPAARKDAVNGSQRDARSNTDPLAYNRRTSLGSQSDRRRMLADDRSPLQRLELTLDSISKEEKRARVEAAEQLVREKEAREHDRPPNHQQQVRFRDEPPRDAGPAADHPAQDQPEIAVHKGPLSQNPPEEGKRYGSMSGRSSARGEVPESRIPVRAGTQASGLPQRNLSFRERAERNDLKLPRANGSDTHLPVPAPAPAPPHAPEPPQAPAPAPAAAAAAAASASISLTRSGSKKLKKEPPGDPWFSRRLEAEKKYPTIQARNEAALESQSSESTPGRGSVRAKAVDADRLRVPSDDDSPRSARSGRLMQPGAAKLTKSPSQRKPIIIADPARTAPAAADRGDDAGHHLGAAAAATAAAGAVMTSAVQTRREARPHSDDENDGEGFSQHHHHLSSMVYDVRAKLKPGQGLYKPPEYLDEWRKATIGTLSGALLDLSDEVPASADRDKPWWETPSRRRGSLPARPMKAEAFDGEYDETNAPTRFKPPLYLKCGPLLRFCGTRTERAPSRSGRNGAAAERDIWRGSVMIVTQDSESSYDIAPTLRMFLQPIELIPPPPVEVEGEVPPEYVDPIAGHPKLGRKGETLYVRPVEHLKEETDLSRDETDDGLFEKTRSPLRRARDARSSSGPARLFRRAPQAHPG